MSFIILLILLVPVCTLAAVVIFRRAILSSRLARIGVAVAALPGILFCCFGFLATFEGGDPIFMAFRIAYGLSALVLSGLALFLALGRVRLPETTPAP